MAGGKKPATRGTTTPPGVVIGHVEDVTPEILLLPARQAGKGACKMIFHIVVSYDNMGISGIRYARTFEVFDTGDEMEPYRRMVDNFNCLSEAESACIVDGFDNVVYR